jgi:hypothetical protein
VVADTRPRRDGRVAVFDLREATIPAVFVSAEAGAALRQGLADRPGLTLRIDPRGLAALSPDAVSGFSSRGSSRTGVLKPDLVAPGEDIFAGALTGPETARIDDPSGFAPAAGTSQAVAHVAGAAALLRQRHPDWSPATIRSALVTTAVPVRAEPGDVLAFSAGGGRLDVPRAAATTVTVTPPSFLLSDLRRTRASSIDGVVRLQLSNETGAPITVRAGSGPLAGPPGVGVSVVPAAVSLAPHATAAVDVVVDVMRGARRGARDGAVSLTPSDGPELRVPFVVQVR